MNHGIDQTATRHTPPHAVFRGAGEFLEDVLTLTELQAALLRTDIRDSLPSLRRIGGLILLAVVLGLSGAPLALLAFAFFLQSHGWPLWGGLAVSAAAGSLAAAAFAAIAWRRCRALPLHFTRSAKAVRQNFAWLKRIVARPDSSTHAA